MWREEEEGHYSGVSLSPQPRAHFNIGLEFERENGGLGRQREKASLLGTECEREGILGEKTRRAMASECAQ